MDTWQLATVNLPYLETKNYFPLAHIIIVVIVIIERVSDLSFVWLIFLMEFSAIIISPRTDQCGSNSYCNDPECLAASNFKAI